MSENATPAETTTRPRVVVVGAGFGGLTVAKALAHAPVDVVLFDKRNYHLFQPLLYQVATAGLSPADIAWPIRSILAHEKNVRVVMAEITGIDVAARQVETRRRKLGYDTLVLATGAREFYFGHDDWAEAAPGLKTLADATGIRRRILLAFERAETTEDAAERARLLTFAIVGGGPTGVELAGTIAELSRKALARDFRHIDPAAAHVVLIEGGPRLLAAFPERLSDYTKRTLERLGVDVRLNAMVTACDASGVALGGERLPAATVLWAAGVAASPAAKWLGLEGDRMGRVEVGPDLAVPGHPEIFVIGDTALVRDKRGEPLPGIAPVAKQQGSYVARVIRARLAGKRPPRPFRYRNMGILATIGRRAAVIDFSWVRFTGRLAWWIWGVVHIYFLIGMRNRVMVALHWLWNYVTFQRGARLITGAGED